MTWIVREGVVGPGVRGTGRHLWGADTFRWDWTLGGAGGRGTIGGGQYEPVPKPLAPWWLQGQCGAIRYATRDEAWRVAARVGGRVVKLVPRSTQARSDKGERT